MYKLKDKLNKKKLSIEEKLQEGFLKTGIHDIDEILKSLEHLEREELAQIDFVLERINNGKYYLCSSCESTISKSRLKSLPFSSVCSTCAKKT